MLRAMVFIDLENFNIAKHQYYKKRALEEARALAAQSGEPAPVFAPFNNPKLDFNLVPKELVKLLPVQHDLVKTFLFAPKPDEFLMGDPKRANSYGWINGMKYQDYFTVIEGSLIAKPVAGYTYQTMSIDNPASFYVEERGTDINFAAHVLTKGLMNAYDTAIIMSADSDYIPVMDMLNTVGKTVAVVGVQDQNMYSFKHHSDIQILLDEEFFQRCLRQ